MRDLACNADGSSVWRVSFGALAKGAGLVRIAHLADSGFLQRLSIRHGLTMNHRHGRSIGVGGSLPESIK